MTVTEQNDSVVEDKIEQLRQIFEKEMKADMYENKHTFYRFLKARDFDVDQAEIMLRKHLAWRKENNVENIMSTKPVPEELEKLVPQTIIGFDKEDAPVKYIAFGNMDCKGMRMAAKFNDFRKCLIKITEEEMAVLDKQSKKIGKELEGSIYIYDMKNFSFVDATDKKTIEHSIKFIRMYQDNFPERLKMLYIINASTYFSMAYSLIKNFLASEILRKIRIFTGPEEYEPELLKLIDADILPAFLGGKRTDPDGDPRCLSFVRHGGPVPPHLFIHKSKNALSKAKGVKKLVIPRASFSEIELEVKECGSLIEWEFETKSRDIGFGLFLKEIDGDGEENITELVPLLRLDTEDFSETGLYRCEKVGTYVILFDNSYSWVRAKEIYYKVTVVSSTEHESEILT